MIALTVVLVLAVVWVAIRRWVRSPLSAVDVRLSGMERA